MSLKWSDLVTSNPSFDDEEEDEDGAQLVRPEGLEIETTGRRKMARTRILADEDPKYSGRRISRKEALGSDGSESWMSSSEVDVDEAFSESETESVDHGDEVDDEEKNAPESQDVLSSLLATREEECRKGQAVRQQVQRFDKLLELRIRIQKSLSMTQSLPAPAIQPAFLDLDADVRVAWKGAVDQGRRLLSTLLDLQESVSDASSPKRAKNSVQEFEDVARARHAQIASGRDAIVEKWGEKTRVASGRTETQRRTWQHRESGILGQIEQVLADKNRLILRSRTSKKEEAPRFFGSSAAEEGEVFDDLDFYQQLLREVIERKTEDVPNVSLEIEKLRKNLKKRNDPSANKGRRVNFEPIPKLVNFMSSTYVKDDMSDSAKNQLFSSLFGKHVLPSS